MAQDRHMEYYSFEKVLKELQIEEEELKRLVSEGEIRAFRDDDKMKFKKSDIEGLKKGKMTEPTIILPSGEGGDPSEDSEVLLVEEDTSETLLDIEDLESAESSSANVPTVDFSSSEFEEAPAAASSGSSGTITEELTFEEESASYVLESSDDVLIDSSQDLVPVDDSPSGEETFVDDTGLQTEPLELDSSSDYSSVKSMGQDEEVRTQPVGARVYTPTTMGPQIALVAVSPVSVFFLLLGCLVLLYSGVFMVNTLQDIDTPLTGWLTDMVYEQAPAHYVPAARLRSHLQWRNNKREQPGKMHEDIAREYLGNR